MKTILTLPYRVWLLGAFLVLLPLSCINAASPIDLILQHTLTVALLVVLFATGVRHPLRNSSYTMFFVFLLLHLVGARHLYSFVPYDDWIEQAFGVRLANAFGFERNHYDRLVHLCFGLLLVVPAREFVGRVMNLHGVWQLVIAVWMIIVLSTVYEFLEWGVAVAMSPDAAEKYNGQQGDVWDAHKDMALATLGAVFTAILLPVVSSAREDAREQNAPTEQAGRWASCWWPCPASRVAEKSGFSNTEGHVDGHPQATPQLLLTTFHQAQPTAPSWPRTHATSPTASTASCATSGSSSSVGSEAGAVIDGPGE